MNIGCRLTDGQGDTVVIAGAGGGLGHLAVQIASKGMGFRVIVSDSSLHSWIHTDRR